MTDQTPHCPCPDHLQAVVGESGCPCAERGCIHEAALPAPLDAERLARAIDKAERNGGNYGDMKRHRWLASGILAALGDSA